jgi:hypothetical protein
MRVAGLFAQGARLIAKYDSARSAGLKQRAINAYNYAKTTTDTVYMHYAAGELWRLTGTSSYRTDYEAAWRFMKKNLGPPVTYDEWKPGPFASYAFFQFLKADFIGTDKRASSDYTISYVLSSSFHTGKRDTTKDELEKHVKVEGRDRMILPATSPDSVYAHRHPIEAIARGPDWGLAASVGRHFDSIYGRLCISYGLTDSIKQEYVDLLSLSADFALGGNPHGRVYFTGIGSRPTRQPLHLDGLSFIKVGMEPVPGIPAYGPVQELSTADYYKYGTAGLYPTWGLHPRLWRFWDIRTFVINSEFSMWESSAQQAQLFAAIRAAARMIP